MPHAPTRAAASSPPATTYRVGTRRLSLIVSAVVNCVVLFWLGLLFMTVLHFIQVRQVMRWRIEEDAALSCYHGNAALQCYQRL